MYNALDDSSMYFCPRHVLWQNRARDSERREGGLRRCEHSLRWGLRRGSVRRGRGWRRNWGIDNHSIIDIELEVHWACWWLNNRTGDRRVSGARWLVPGRLFPPSSSATPPARISGGRLGTRLLGTGRRLLRTRRVPCFHVCSPPTRARGVPSSAPPATRICCGSLIGARRCSPSSTSPTARTRGRARCLGCRLAPSSAPPSSTVSCLASAPGLSPLPNDFARGRLVR